MAKSDLFPALNDITFAAKDPDIITNNIIKLYEDTSGRTLARADPVRLFIDAIILAVIQQRNLIDYAAKQNLLAYAENDYLDHLGALLGVSRLQPSHAVCVITFRLNETLSYDVDIPAGTRIASGDGTVFATLYNAVISAGNSAIDTEAQCITAGSQGNGYIPSQINRLIDLLPFGVSAVNITTSSGGTDSESDDAFRERIQIAPESFSVAGPIKAYEYFARSADTDIIDVAVMGPPITEPGCVNIYPLMTEGTLPSQEVLQKVLAACSADNVRPDTDFVSVLSPEVVHYSLNISYWIDEKNSTAAPYIQAAVENAIDAWILWQRKALGRDINPSELVKLVIEAGAKRCEVRSPSFEALGAWEIAVCQDKVIDYAGTETA